MYELRVPAYRQIPERGAQMVAVLRVEARVVHQIDAAADHVAGGEGRPVRLAVARRTERVAVVAVIAERLFVPAGQPVHLEVLRRQADAHVAVASLRDDLHLEVVQATGGGYRMGGAHRGRIVVVLAYSCEKRRVCVCVCARDCHTTT